MNKQPTSPKDIAISNVFVSVEAIAPLTLKYPAGLLMQTIPAHLDCVKQAAADAHIQVFIVCNGKKLLVYHTADGFISSVPAVDPIAFFDAFNRLQIETYRKRNATEHDQSR